MFRWAALIAAIIFVLAIAGAILSSQKSAEPGRSLAAENNHKAPGPKEKELALFDRWFPDSTAVFNLFLMIFTGVLAFGGLIQLNLLTRAERIATETAQAAKDSAEATKKAVELSDRNSEHQLRAYVFLVGGSVILDGNKLSAVIDLKNTGQTPAYDFIVRTRLQTTEPGKPIEITPLDKTAETFPAIVAPGGVVNPRSDLVIPPENTAAIPAFKEGRSIIYYIGEAEYRDAFGKIWILDFRLRSFGFDGRQWVMQPAETGNIERQKN